MTKKEITPSDISAEVELTILRELESLGVLVTCETCGQCDIKGARCLRTVRGNSICGKSLMKGAD